MDDTRGAGRVQVTHGYGSGLRDARVNAGHWNTTELKLIFSGSWGCAYRCSSSGHGSRIASSRTAAAAKRYQFHRELDRVVLFIGWTRFSDTSPPRIPSRYVQLAWDPQHLEAIQATILRGTGDSAVAEGANLERPREWKLFTAELRRQWHVWSGPCTISELYRR